VVLRPAAPSAICNDLTGGNSAVRNGTVSSCPVCIQSKRLDLCVGLEHIPWCFFVQLRSNSCIDLQEWDPSGQAFWLAVVCVSSTKVPAYAAGLEQSRGAASVAQVPLHPQEIGTPPGQAVQ
jgi:hypothetical protein